MKPCYDETIGTSRKGRSNWQILPEFPSGLQANSKQSELGERTIPSINSKDKSYILEITCAESRIGVESLGTNIKGLREQALLVEGGGHTLANLNVRRLAGVLWWRFWVCLLLNVVAVLNVSPLACLIGVTQVPALMNSHLLLWLSQVLWDPNSPSHFRHFFCNSVNYSTFLVWFGMV